MIKILTILLLLPIYGVPQALLDASQSINADKYEWTQLSGSPAIMGSPDSVLCPLNDLRDGNYSFLLKVSNDCCQDVDVVKFHWPLFQVKIIGLKLKITSDKDQEMRISLFNPLGQRLQTYQDFLLEGDNYLQLKKPAAGVYYLQFLNENLNQTEKIIVE